MFINGWIIDTGATNHMTSRAELLSDLRLNHFASPSVGLPNDACSVVIRVCSCDLGGGDILQGAFLVSNFHYNLLSVSKLTHILSCSVTFFS